MIPPFDIFRVGISRLLVRKGTAETFDLARLRIKISMDSEPGDYIIYSRETGHHMIVKADGSIDICSECWTPFAQKLTGKGRAINREIVLLPPPRAVEDEEPEPLPGEPPKIRGAMERLH